MKSDIQNRLRTKTRIEIAAEVDSETAHCFSVIELRSNI